MCGARARSLYAQCERGVRVLYVCYACAATCDSGIAHILPSFEERICLLNVVEGASLFHRRIYFQTREKSLPLNRRRRHRRHFVCTVFVQFIKYIRVFCSEEKKKRQTYHQFRSVVNIGVVRYFLPLYCFCANPEMKIFMHMR